MISPILPGDLVLETPRLRLTPLTLADLDIARSLLCDPQVMEYIAESMTPEAVSDHMPNATRRGAGGRLGIWCVRRRDTGEKIGDGVLLPVPIDGDETDWSLLVPEAYPPDQIEVGYLLVPSAWGQGFATEICARLLSFFFEHTPLPEVVAITNPKNHRSQHVLRKCGMRPLGLRRAYGYDEVQWFETTREEWAGRD